jgi:hypothetical protein
MSRPSWAAREQVFLATRGEVTCGLLPSRLGEA